jgi:starvation-inducible DNA-binding protein
MLINKLNLFSSLVSSTDKERWMKVDIGIAESNRIAVSKILNIILADEFVLYTKTLNYHWNVVGPDFSEYHLFLEAQYKKLAEILDDVAERVRSVGGTAFGSLAEFSSNSRLKEYPGALFNESELIQMLLEDHQTVIISLREQIEVTYDRYHDAGTSNFLTDLMEKHEKMAWMLRSFLERR